MSYILDALKRAEAQRERGHVPGLHSQSTPLSTAHARTARPPLWSLALIAVLGGGLVAVLLRPSASPQGPSAPMAEKQEKPTATHLNAEATVSAPVQAMASTATATTVAEPPVRQPQIKAAPVPIAPAASAVRPVAVKPAMVAAPAQAVQVASAATPATVVPSPAPVMELTEELRRQLPALQITGAIYSDNPTQRLLLVNGLVLPQNSAISPELVLEEIGPRSSIFRFRGNRFKVNH